MLCYSKIVWLLPFEAIYKRRINDTYSLKTLPQEINATYKNRKLDLKVYVADLGEMSLNCYNRKFSSIVHAGISWIRADSQSCVYAFLSKKVDELRSVGCRKWSVLFVNPLEMGDFDDKFHAFLQDFFCNSEEMFHLVVHAQRYV